ncbi:MAG: hypothetical protein AAF749_12125 [Pseudomonadota bacterium]
MSEALSESANDAYNLVFSGQLLPGTDTRDARRLLAAFFGLRDPGAIDVFFSGKRIPLRRKLRKRDALKLYRQLRSAGLICEVEEVTHDTKAEKETALASPPSPAETTSQRLVEREPEDTTVSRELTGDLSTTDPRKTTQPKVDKRKHTKQKDLKQRVAARRAPKQQTLRTSDQSKTGLINKEPSNKNQNNKPPSKEKINGKAASEKSQKEKGATVTVLADEHSSKKAAKGKEASQKRSNTKLANTNNALPAKSPRAGTGKEQSLAVQPQTAAIARNERGRPKSFTRKPSTPNRNSEFKGGQAPNLFALRPALQSEKTKERAEKVQLQAMVSGAIAVALLLVLATISIRFPPLPPAPEPAGAIAAASSPSNRLLVLTPSALLEHERSGLGLRRISTSSLGLAGLEPPLLFLDEDRVLVGATATEGTRGLFDCRLQEGVCEYQAELSANGVARALARSYLGDAIYTLSEEGSLARIGDGKIEIAPTPIQLSERRTQMLLMDGLLHVPAPEGPLLGVYRPDTARLGEQLDALFLLAPLPDDSTVERIHDVAASIEYRWALIESSLGEVHLFRFDRAWGNAQRISSGSLSSDSYLSIWRERPLIFHTKQTVAERFSPTGEVEVPFDSRLLREEHELWLQDERRRLLIKNLGIGLPLFLALLSAIYCWLNVAAARALASGKDIRTELLDPIPAGILWAVQVENRERRIRNLAALIAVLGVGFLSYALITAPAVQAAVWVPLVALSVHGALSMFKGCGGYLGMIGDRSIVVDHDGRYFYGKRSNIYIGQRFVVAPNVVLPLGWSWLPNLDASHFRAVLDAEAKLSLRPAPRSFIDLLGTLWYLRHPWLRGALTALFGGVLSAALFLLA